MAEIIGPMYGTTSKIPAIIASTKAGADLAQPQWFGQLSLADPAKSGSVKTSYEMILQQYGWEKGWAVITELFANAAMVRDNGGAPGDDAGSAEAVGGIHLPTLQRLGLGNIPALMALRESCVSVGKMALPGHDSSI